MKVLNAYMIPVWMNNMSAVEWKKDKLVDQILKNEEPILASDHQALFASFMM